MKQGTSPDSETASEWCPPQTTDLTLTDRSASTSRLAHDQMDDLHCLFPKNRFSKAFFWRCSPEMFSRFSECVKVWWPWHRYDWKIPELQGVQMFFQLCKARKRYLSLTETDEKMDTSAANPAFKDLRVHEFCAIATIYKMGKYVKWHNQSKMPLVVNERAGRPRSFTDCLRRRRCRLRGSSSASDVASRNELKPINRFQLVPRFQNEKHVWKFIPARVCHVSRMTPTRASTEGWHE